MENKQTIFSNKIFKNTYVFILCLLIGYALNIVFLRLPEFDFYSYHYYNGWAFWNNRLSTDIMPCFFRTYFSPLLDAFNYFMIERLNNHPLLFIILSSFKYGILMFIAYKFYDFIWSKFGDNNIFSLIFCFTTAAATPIMIYCLSFEMTDIQVAIFLLLGFYIYLKNVFNTGAKWRMFYIFISALIVGIAFGLKYTGIAFAISLFISTLFFYKKIEHPIKTIMTVMAGFLLGFVITDGFWMISLYAKFRNPFFPYFNNIFHSTMAGASSVISSDFGHLLPKNPLEWLLLPLENSAIKSGVGFEYYHFDLKMVLGFISVLASFFLLKIKSFREDVLKTDENFNIFVFLLLVTTFAYYINNSLFANIRYIIPIFVIIPVILCIVIKYAVKPELYNYCLAAIILVSIATIYIPKGTRIIWQQPDNIIYVNNMQLKDNSTVICGTLTSCFIAPYQNPNVRYVGYSLDKETAEQGFYSIHSLYKNMYYTNEPLKNVVKDILQKEKDVYFVYSAEMFGRDMHDLDLYEKSLSEDLGKKVDLTKCRNLRYFVYDILRANSDFYVCKIK